MCISTEQDIESPSMGSEREMLGYSEALAERGHVVSIVNVLRAAPDWNIDYDVCHLVNAGGWKGAPILTAQMCKLKGIPVVISPVYWPTDEMQREIAEKFKKNPELVSDQFGAHLQGVKSMLEEADWLLPNAEIEMDRVAELLYGDTSNLYDDEIDQIGYTVISNGVDVANETDMALRLNYEELLFDDSLEDILADRFILCVGRVEIRKNQASLVEAMKPLWEEDPDLQLVLMGAKSIPYVDYIKEEIKGKNILFCPPGPPVAVAKMMRRCAVHVLVSLIETPGLVNLEAAALNKPIVVADRGSVSEYFGSEPGVFYCDPFDIEGMTFALRGALKMKEANVLGDFVRKTYSHAKIAGDIEAVYEKVIASTRKGNIK